MPKENTVSEAQLYTRGHPPVELLPLNILFGSGAMEIVLKIGHDEYLLL